ncbi:MAG: YopX family protein [Clostridium chrysemydis]|uniref:YopX family protein n=1 Tax=Clostridium chrysemydis TaxID=2665504 RepID=UPI003F2E9557
MREIKFRAWDKTTKKLQDVYSINFGNKDVWLKENKKRIIGANFFEIELMQYIGLKDKNGKEIYEGDILKDDYGKIDRVIYYDYMFDLENFYDNGYEIANQAFSEGTDKFEVIGNIYENPELLK